MMYLQRTEPTGSIGLIIISLVLAVILTLLPLPEWAIWLRPAWLLMVLLYWTFSSQGMVGMGSAWFLGICLDVLNGTLLGEHALALTLAVFVAIKLQNSLRLSTWLSQGILLVGCVFIYQLILFCVQGFIAGPLVNWRFWLVPLTSMLFWPWIYFILRDCQYRWTGSRS